MYCDSANTINKKEFVLKQNENTHLLSYLKTKSMIKYGMGLPFISSHLNISNPLTKFIRYDCFLHYAIANNRVMMDWDEDAIKLWKKHHKTLPKLTKIDKNPKN